MKSGPAAIVVGNGFGCRVQLPALRAAGFEVVGLVGRDRERTARKAERAGVPHAFTDLDEAISRTGAKVVTIATPPHTHAPLTLMAIARGCHVVCEKPFAMNAAEAKAMLDAAERAGVVGLVGHEFRWATERALTGRAIAEGLIGKPRMLTYAMYTAIVAGREQRMPAWWYEPESGGGWLGASGSHVIDQVRNWIGEFESVSAALPIVADRRDGAEDSHLVRFRSVSGVDGVLQQTGGAWGPIASMTRVAGTHGTVWLENGAVKVADASGTRELPVPPDLVLPVTPHSDDPRQQYLHLELAPYTRLCEGLRATLEGRGDSLPVPLPTFADGLACVQVLEAIRQSAANGGAVVRIEASGLGEGA
jgi:predicted dehydrogenase